MAYYEIRVASQRYRSPLPLTYMSDEPLVVGGVVVVELQSQMVLGIVLKKAQKPKFTTKLVQSVVSHTSLPTELLQLVDWLAIYYPAPTGIIAQLCLPSALLVKSRKKEITQAKTEPVQPVETPSLTAEQSSALDAIQTANGQSVLIHGDTGTGKTRLYLELAKKTIESGRSCLVLTPEISLTPQLVTSFKSWFPDQVTVVHSEQTTVMRRENWQAILTSDKPQVVIGPRSALFAPLHNIGLIVVDEMHDDAYKQEQAPHYQTTRVAGYLARLHGAQLVMGSATPSISDYYTFQTKQLPIVRLIQSAKGQTETVDTQVIDLNDRQHKTRSQHFSNELLSAITTALQNHTQSLVFLNRRGTARLMLCQSCGWKAVCPKCDLHLTYHSDTHKLRCHTCGHLETAPSNCPSCKSVDIIFRSSGTKALVSELERLFPKARIQRFDSDNTKAESLEEHYQAVHSGKVDILVGTQMLSKGLDLPKLAVVGVVLADTGLYFPDYTAEEKTFQMLSQVMGRVGRGHQSSTVIVQTYNPASPALVASVQKDYSRFYDRELEERRSFAFPPFYYLLKLSCSRKSSEKAYQAATELAVGLHKSNLPIQIIGPSPAFTEKTSNSYRWQIVVKAPQRSSLLEVIQLLPANWDYDLDPANLL